MDGILSLLIRWLWARVPQGAPDIRKERAPIILYGVGARSLHLELIRKFFLWCFVGGYAADKTPQKNIFRIGS